MEKETMYWLFTTAPQIVGALVGIIFTGMFFVASNIKSRIITNQGGDAPNELCKVSEVIYKNMSVVAKISGFTLSYDLLMIYLTPIIAHASGEIHCFFFWLKLLFAGLNIGSIIAIFYYALDVVNPHFINRISDNLTRSK